MPELDSILILAFITFIRVSTAMMLLPAFASAQVQMRARLLLALAISISVFFTIESLPGYNVLGQLGGSLSPIMMLRIAVSEILIGAFLALPVRLLFHAFTFAGEVMTQMIGLNAIPGMPVGDQQPSTTLSSLLSMAAMVLFFASGVHLHFIFALAGSFEILRPGEFYSIAVFTERLANELSEFFKITIRLAAPIIIYSVIMNFIAGLTNKLTPQIPIYFVSTPFLIFGGIFILILIGDDILYLFNVELLLLMERLF